MWEQAPSSPRSMYDLGSWDGRSSEPRLAGHQHGVHPPGPLLPPVSHSGNQDNYSEDKQLVTPGGGPSPRHQHRYDSS